MSINSLANAAIARRPDFEPLNEVPQGLNAIARAAATPAGVPPGPAVGTPEESANAVNTALHVLFGYIPTEVLTLYVAILAALQNPAPSGAVQSVGSPGAAIAKVSTGEWIAFWCFLVATPIVVWLVYGAKLKAAKKPLPPVEEKACMKAEAQ